MSAAPPLRQTSPAAERNKGPITEQLQRLLPASGRLLEIASGSGQHAVHGAAALPGWHWQPSDTEATALGSIRAWRQHSGLANLAPPLALDVLSQPWPVDGLFDALFCANMLHIAPWPCCAALMQGAARHLAADGRLLIYGPFQVEGQATAPSNLAFDADLRQRHPQWGLRWLHEVAAEAERTGLALQQRVAMPANNLLLVFARPR
ncbi:MAG: DUF938 domain-containing protein [Burkholderiaceae bacterium]|nr:DUF938 domain-containing protein [Burkholderiaceae bacterium]